MASPRMVTGTIIRLRAVDLLHIGTLRSARRVVDGARQWQSLGPLNSLAAGALDLAGGRQPDYSPPLKSAINRCTSRAPSISASLPATAGPSRSRCRSPSSRSWPTSSLPTPTRGSWALPPSYV